jgi:hypothetical protein
MGYLMAQCAFIKNVSGVDVLAADAAVSGACSSLVVLSVDEYANWQNNPLNLSASDGFLMSVAIVGIWGAAFGWRALVRVLDNNDGNSSSE